MKTNILPLILSVFSLVRCDGSYFTKVPFRELQGVQLESLRVRSVLECCMRCDQLPCLSVNVADQPNIDGLYQCILLQNTYNMYLLKKTSVFHHFTRIMDSAGCASQGCKNGGTCELSGSSFQCRCTTDFEGDLCERLRATSIPPRSSSSEWIKQSTEGCSSFSRHTNGKFTLQQNGIYNALRLNYVSGGFYCSPGSKAGSASVLNYWGCNETLEMVITNDLNSRVLPILSSINLIDENKFTYKLTGYNTTSPEIIFYFALNISRTAGKKYLIWMGPTLYRNIDSVVTGSVCVDAYLNRVLSP